MTKKQAEKKIREMMRTEEAVFWEKVQKALSSGAINMEEYEDNYLLPKIIMSAVHGEMEWQYKPVIEKDKKAVKKIKAFL